MQFTPRKQEGLNHDYHVVVNAMDIERQMENELSAIGRRAKIPGFRPGKVPMNILRQRYGKNVMGEVIENSVNNAAQEVFKKNKIRPALKPDIKITEYKEGGDLEFDMVFEAMPEVPEFDFSDLKITKQVCKASDEEIEESVETLAANHKPFSPAEDSKAKAQKGDAVNIDFVGKKDGVEFDGGKGNGFQLELGGGQFIPGFEEQLIGSKAGDEVTVNVTFPEAYHSADLAGADAEFAVKINEVLVAKGQDAIDDDFAEQMGFANLDALKDAVRAQLQGDYDNQSRAKAKKSLFDAMDEIVKFEIPGSMVKLEFDSIWEQVEKAREEGDEELASKTEEELKTEYEAVAERRVRLGIFLSEVSYKKNLQVTQEELTGAVMAQARMFPGQEQKIFEYYKQNPQEVEQLKGPILEEKAVDYILTHANVEEVEVSAEELEKDDDEVPPATAAKKKPAAKKSAKKSVKKEASKNDASKKEATSDKKPSKKAAPKKAAPKKAASKKTADKKADKKS